MIPKLFILLNATLLLLAACNSPNEVNWETASEVGTAGFNIYRSSSEEGPWTLLNETLIEASPDPISGGQYTFEDSSAEPGVAYFYQLEEIELSGNSNRYPPTQLQTKNAWNNWLLVLAGSALAIALGWWLGTRFRNKQAV